MDDKEFEALVRRLEAEEAKSPSAHKGRVILLAALGYGYIALVLLGLMALLAGVIAIIATGHGIGALIKPLIALVVAAGFILRAMWVKFPAPEGRQLRRQEAPLLFAEAQELATRLRAPEADVVLLTTDFNASVTQIPRLGMLGFSRNYLCIGTPLLAALPKEHVRSVLAHEFAHLSHAHGKFGSWIYRVRVTWFQLLEALERQQHWSAGVFRGFFRWYVPRFSAYTLVLSRRHEFEADQLAADIVGREQMAQTLVDLEVRGDDLARRFWPTTWEEAKVSPQPPSDIYSRLAETTARLIPADSAQQGLAAAMRRETEVADTHPALKERLASLLAQTTNPSPSGSFGDSAITSYLAPNHDTLTAEMNSKWRFEVAKNWSAQHKAVEEARDGVARLGARPASELTPEERFQLACWTEDLSGTAAALPMFEALYASDPTNPALAYSVGRLRLHAGDESGLALLEEAMSREPNSILPACQIAVAFLERTDHPERAAPFRERAAAHYTLLSNAQLERSGISVEDRFVPSEVPTDVRETLVTQLDHYPAVEKAYLVRKTVQHLVTEAPMHVLAVHVSGSFVTSQKEQRDAATRLESSFQVPDGVHLFVLTDEHRRLFKPLSAVPGGLLYEAKTRKAERKQAQRK